MPVFFMSRKVQPIGQIHDQASLELIAEVARDALLVAHHNSKAGAYLLADSEGNVYVLGCGSAWNEAIVNRKVHLLVGTYCERRTPTVNDIEQDLCHHLEQLRRGLAFA